MTTREEVIEEARDHLARIVGLGEQVWDTVGENGYDPEQCKVVFTTVAMLAFEDENGRTYLPHNVIPPIGFAGPNDPDFMGAILARALAGIHIKYGPHEG